MSENAKPWTQAGLTSEKRVRRVGSAVTGDYDGDMVIIREALTAHAAQAVRAAEESLAATERLRLVERDTARAALAVAERERDEAREQLKRTALVAADLRADLDRLRGERDGLARLASHLASVALNGGAATAGAIFCLYEQEGLAGRCEFAALTTAAPAAGREEPPHPEVWCSNCGHAGSDHGPGSCLKCNCYGLQPGVPPEPECPKCDGDGWVTIAPTSPGGCAETADCPRGCVQPAQTDGDELARLRTALTMWCAKTGSNRRPEQAGTYESGISSARSCVAAILEFSALCGLDGCSVEGFHARGPACGVTSLVLEMPGVTRPAPTPPEPATEERCGKCDGSGVRTEHALYGGNAPVRVRCECTPLLAPLPRAGPPTLAPPDPLAAQVAGLKERVAGLERSRDAYAHQLAGIAEELDAGRRRHAETKDEHAARLAALEETAREIAGAMRWGTRREELAAREILIRHPAPPVAK